jgi:hypothetical protein
MKPKRIKHLAIAAAIVAFVIFQAYLESVLNLTPNH